MATRASRPTSRLIPDYYNPATYSGGRLIDLQAWTSKKIRWRSFRKVTITTWPPRYRCRLSSISAKKYKKKHFFLILKVSSKYIVYLFWISWHWFLLVLTLVIYRTWPGQEPKRVVLKTEIYYSKMVVMSFEEVWGNKTSIITFFKWIPDQKSLTGRCKKIGKIWDLVLKRWPPPPPRLP